MVVGLEEGAHEHVGLAVFQPVVLRGLDVAMHVDVAYVGGIDGSVLILIVQGAGVGKPAPDSLVSHDIGGKERHGRAEEHGQHQNQSCLFHCL